MSDVTAKLPNSVPEPVVEIAHGTLSPPRSPFPPSQSRIADSADGLGREDGERAGEGGEDEEEDFVAVGHEDVADYLWYFRRPPVSEPSKLDELHPFVQLLSLSNVDDCERLEETFPENERCSREKVRGVYGPYS